MLPSTTDDDTTGDKSARDALSYLHMLNECASTSEKHMNMSSAVDDDQVAKWWLAVGMVAVYWLQGEDEAAERFYSTIESVPKSLWNAEYVDINIVELIIICISLPGPSSLRIKPSRAIICR